MSPVNKILAEYPKLDSTHGPKDRETVLSCLYEAMRNDIPGDIVEMGCHVGNMTICLLGMVKELGADKKVYGVDAFQGLPDKTAPDLTNDNCNRVDGGLKCSRKQLVENITGFDAGLMDKLVILEGLFSEVTGYPDQVCFAFFDGDLYESIKDSFDIIYPRVSPGGIICVHDYSNCHYPGVRAITDKYMSGKNDVCTIKSGVLIINKEGQNAGV